MTKLSYIIKCGYGEKKKKKKKKKKGTAPMRPHAGLIGAVPLGLVEEEERV